LGHSVLILRGRNVGETSHDCDLKLRVFMIKSYRSLPREKEDLPFIMRQEKEKHYRGIKAPLKIVTGFN